MGLRTGRQYAERDHPGYSRTERTGTEADDPPQGEHDPAQILKEVRGLFRRDQATVREIIPIFFFGRVSCRSAKTIICLQLSKRIVCLHARTVSVSPRRQGMWV